MAKKQIDFTDENDFEQYKVQDENGSIKIVRPGHRVPAMSLWQKEILSLVINIMMGKVTRSQKIKAFFSCVILIIFLIVGLIHCSLFIVNLIIK